MRKESSRRKAGRLAFEANIMDGLADPVILLDENRAVVDANLAARKLLGPSALGNNLSETLNAPEIIKLVNEVLAGKHAKKSVVDIPFPVARTYEMSVWDLSPRTLGKAVWAMLVLHDITAAIRADQMRVDFISNVSHELRSPLSSLVSFIETLRGPAKDDPQAQERFLSIMETEANRMTHLINDLLALSKLETEEHILPEGKVDLYQLFKQVGTVLLIRAEKRGMTISIECPPGLPQVNGDDGELTQVFRNLLDNAINYGYENTPILVTLKAQDKDIVASVANQGDGIEPKHLSRLTERFYRVDKGRSRSMGGTGLGLAIVKHIVNRHRGRLDIDSASNDKTTFTVSLPCAGMLS